MGVHYDEAMLDRAADLYWLQQASDARLHKGLTTVEEDALEAHHEAIAEHKRLIDARQDEVATAILREYGLDLNA